MSEQNNLAAEMLKAWQDHLQNSMKDARISELMVEQYSKFQDLFKGANENYKSSQSSDNSAIDDVHAKLAYITDRLEAMEARLTIIEKSIAAASTTSEKRS